MDLAKKAINLEGRKDEVCDGVFLESTLMPCLVVIELDDLFDVDIPDQIADEIETVQELIDVCKQVVSDKYSG